MSADQSVFLATIDEQGEIVYDFPQQQRAYCKRKLAGQCVDVIIAPQGALKTRLQECGFHAMISPWAKEEGHAIDDLKRDLLRHIFGEREHVNPITGVVEMVLREPHTSTLSRTKYGELIERTLDIAAEYGYILEAPAEYRQRKERERKKGGGLMNERGYCLNPACDETPWPGEALCQTCQESDVRPPIRRLTRTERLEGLADAGYDTRDWEER